MSTTYQIVVCAGIVPDPLQTLEPVMASGGPALKNEMLLPHVLDPWAAHALYEAAHLAKQFPGSKVYLASVAPKAKLQQVMMTIGQRVALELIAVDAPAAGFSDAGDVAALLASTIESIPALDRSKMLLFGGWESASRCAGATLQMVGERLGIAEQFQGVDELRVQEDGSLRILERVEGGQHQISVCTAPPAVLGWATGNLPEPSSNPQIGMQNMRAIMPALQKAAKAELGAAARFSSVTLPNEQRDTRVVKNKTSDEIAREIVEWAMAE